ncbi:MAG: AI-2E family transporter, partial [bacterium]
IIIALISAATIFAGRVILNEFSNFYSTILKYFEQVPETVSNLFEESGFSDFSFENLESNFSDSLNEVFGSVRENMVSWITNITNVGTTIVLIPIITFFLLKDDKLLYNNIRNLIPSKYTVRVTDIIKKIDSLLHNYFFGQLIVAGFLGVITYIGYIIIGLPSALLLAVITMILSIIPFLGPLMGVIPAIILGWTINPIMVLKVILVLIVTQQLEGNIIRPKIIGKELKIHPMMIIFLVIIAVALYGFVGAFFAIPVYGILRIIVKDLIKHIRDKREVNKNPEL